MRVAPPEGGAWWPAPPIDRPEIQLHLAADLIQRPSACAVSMPIPKTHRK